MFVYMAFDQEDAFKYRTISLFTQFSSLILVKKWLKPVVMADVEVRDACSMLIPCTNMVKLKQSKVILLQI